MNGHDDDFDTAFDPTDDERRRAEEEDMWLEYEAMCAERDAALADDEPAKSPGYLEWLGVIDHEDEPDEPSDADLFDRGMRVGTAGWAWARR